MKKKFYKELVSFYVVKAIQSGVKANLTSVQIREIIKSVMATYNLL